MAGATFMARTNEISAMSARILGLIRIRPHRSPAGTWMPLFDTLLTSKSTVPGDVIARKSPRYAVDDHACPRMARISKGKLGGSINTERLPGFDSDRDDVVI